MQVPNEASACYRELYPEWSALAAEPHGCALDVVQARQSFGRAFDDDDSLAYTPECTAAIILSEWGPPPSIQFLGGAKQGGACSVSSSRI